MNSYNHPVKESIKERNYVIYYTEEEDITYYQQKKYTKK